ncbi:hypothetical protein PRIPAC_81045 [Pristionchus pacificus]|uniref:G protein-coupled receptor n=1 Tax=Pristionchus pacificus TaxID=54126 RepID=A0A2A6CNB1_PRIPA|nr:hypothetical protein PRIPAC_81045 [Pristionchus pacificus]|eukprot:PDM79586.1 G protein-coupled receptor [Pristionchus pacificus]
MTNYYDYTMDFEWDRRYFMPNYAPSVTMNIRYYLQAVQIFFDIHHSYLFIPYPLFPMPIFVCHGLLCRWGAPTRLLMVIRRTLAKDPLLLTEI